MIESSIFDFRCLQVGEPDGIDVEASKNKI